MVIMLSSVPVVVAAIVAFMIVMFGPSGEQRYRLEQAWEQKCKDAGGIPSKYRNVQGKHVDEERACFHPSALINID